MLPLFPPFFSILLKRTALERLAVSSPALPVVVDPGSGSLVLSGTVPSKTP